MENIDIILRDASKGLFSDLDPLHRRILERLAKYGSMSLTELGHDKRWDMKLRLDGTRRTVGLIPNGFVDEYKIKKRKKFVLGFKGLLAVLTTTNFEDINMIKQYRNILKGVINDEQILDWALNFIKYEIALILYYNYLQGLNWTKFKYVLSYWEELKSYDKNSVETFFAEGYSFGQHDVENYYEIEKEYLTLFSILDHLTFFVKWGYIDERNSVYQFKSDQTFRQYVDRWHIFIKYHNLDEINDLIAKSDYFDDYSTNFVKDTFHSKITDIRNEARKILLDKQNIKH